MKNNFLVKHDFDKTLDQLKNDKNNIVALLCENEIVYDSNQKPLNGLLYTLKDLFATKKFYTQGSSKTLDKFMPFYDSEVYKLLNENGAKMVAKVHNDEFGLGGSGEYSAYGMIKHPLDTSRIIGGSSSGSVASMYYDINFSIGSDTGDSVRNPAGFNGFVGFKPTYGAISRYGLFSYASSMDTVAYFTHCVKDAHTLSKVLYKKDHKDMTSVEINLSELKSIKPNKVALMSNDEYLSKEVKDAYQKLATKLQKENIDVEFVEIDREVLNDIKYVYDVVSYSEAVSNLSNLKGLQFGNIQKAKDWEQIVLKYRSTLFGDMVQRRLTLGNFFLDANFIKEMFHGAQKIRKKVVDYFRKIHNLYDLFIYPAAPDVAPKILNSDKPNYSNWILTNSNLTGNPSIVIPWIEKNNLPIGLAIDAKYANDQELLNHSYFIESLLGVKDE
ncbi:aspartyl/glutamyl-tRNA(Asn/Gln) amidotransferase subunit A [Mycoplasma testudineum]|uniref:Aspartyl/glutamyl-tRNA(Asn/Gln) amidotransferase subunit A n=1 Tax=Mycoplasma testudineum TaxID=244584 RepID=A0A4R6IEN3_9MOLU|nr:amidase family protein [Mycoplasma testudineum]OYD26896.1 Asp-tRNA(Asn)/Glu-tRNA(Gln) amidotransferase GatCAB subunit A [Mycoplasma testudineum]TDO20444.1 aspartyl/glutamyl-tRNA(Asn/Gln) amidotransferase subunit A [Mycoplasma testudineum]